MTEEKIFLVSEEVIKEAYRDLNNYLSVDKATGLKPLTPMHMSLDKIQKVELTKEEIDIMKLMCKAMITKLETKDYGEQRKEKELLKKLEKI
jgi:hypothetical protein